MHIQQLVFEEHSRQIGMPDERLDIEAAPGHSGAARADDKSLETSAHEAKGGLPLVLGFAWRDQLIEQRLFAGFKGSLDR